MSVSLRDLARRAEALPPPAFDAATVIRQGEARLRRRRATTWVAAAVAVGLVGFGMASLDRGNDRSAPPARHDKKTDVVPAPPVRVVTYGAGYWPTTSIHYGDRTVDIREQLAYGRPGRGGIAGVVHMDVTDDGVVFTTEGGGIWFTDGSSTHLIGEKHNYLGIRNNQAVVSSTAGSRVAWWTDPDPAIVVYDTNADHEVRRVPVPGCTAFRTATCELRALVGDDHVYFVRGDFMHHRPDVLMRLDVPTGRLERVTLGELAADQASTPRGLILGKTPETGVVNNGYGTVFAVKGARLRPMRYELAPQDPYNSYTAAFDTGTKQRVRFRLPVDYHGADEFTAFEWLDDDTLALMNAANTFHQTTADILTCRISTGRCDLVTPAKPKRVTRIAPHLGLPG